MEECAGYDSRIRKMRAGLADTSQGFSAAHIALVVSTIWILMLNAAVGFQVIEDGTPLSTGLLIFSSLLIFIGTGYIALDTGFSWTGFFDKDLNAPNQSYPLYTLYQLVPLVFLFIFFCLETYLVLRILGERKPMGKCCFNFFRS